jgi:hypothetical protein
MKWNDIPWDEDADPEIKAMEFDLQVEENSHSANGENNE